MRIKDGKKLDFDDVLIVPQRTKTISRKDVDIHREFRFYNSYAKWDGVPIFAANMFNTGTVKMSKSLQSMKVNTCLHKFYSVKDINTHFLTNKTDYRYNWISIGAKSKDIEKLRQIQRNLFVMPNICIDVANGYTEDFVKFCAQVRKENLSSIIMAGNVCTPEMVQELIIHGGVDIVKIGIGPGSHCTTRKVTGCGYPQLSAILECANAAHGLSSGEKRLGLICADGGCKTPGDICKAFCANADFVMIGGMLMGCDECEGKWIRGLLGRKKLKCYGMSSEYAQQIHGDGLKDYRASEGITSWVEHKGPVKRVMQDIAGGIRSCCTYIGASKIKDMSKCAEFVIK